MGSPPHRALLLAPNATKLGVGVACNGTEHDAVAWIETQSEAQNSSPTPVVTKSTAGSRCKGPVSSPATTVTTRAAAATTTLARNAAASTTTTSRPAIRSTTTSSVAVAAAATGGTPFQSTSDPPAASAALALQTASGRPIVASSRPLARSRDVGAIGTMVLLMTFVGALLVARTARPRPRP
jgi:hypothetical protein